MGQVLPVVDGGVEDGGDVDETGNISIVGILNVFLNLKYSLESHLDSIEGFLQLPFNPDISCRFVAAVAETVLNPPGVFGQLVVEIVEGVPGLDVSAHEAVQVPRMLK